MLAGQRRARVLDELRRAGGVKVSQLTGLLGVSDMTVRRDLEQLDSAGMLHRVHGGAVPGGNVTEEPGFEANSSREQPAKQAIAARAAELVRPGTAIAVSAGTTTWAMARHLTSVHDLTVVTNSTTIAHTISALATSGRRTVILTGGARTPSAALVGPVAQLAIRSLHVDQLFIGVHGIDPDAGFTTPNIAEAQTNRTLIECARQVVVVADSTKWSNVGLADFGALSDADVLITDDGLPEEAKSALAEQIAEVIIVSPRRRV